MMTLWSRLKTSLCHYKICSPLGMWILLLLWKLLSLRFNGRSSFSSEVSEVVFVEPTDRLMSGALLP